MSLPLKKATEEVDAALTRLRELVVRVAAARFDADAVTGAIPGIVSEAAYLLNTGQHHMVRALLDLHDECVEAQVNLDIAKQSVLHEHLLDLEADPEYLSEESDAPPLRILERDYEKVVTGDPADLGTGLDSAIIRLARLDPDEV
jgi:fructose-1,6-bisphosphatase